MLASLRSIRATKIRVMTANLKHIRSPALDIAYAYDSFDNQTMYALMLFVVLLAVTLNAALHVWEQRMMARRRRT